MSLNQITTANRTLKKRGGWNEEKGKSRGVKKKQQQIPERSQARGQEKFGEGEI